MEDGDSHHPALSVSFTKAIQHDVVEEAPSEVSRNTRGEEPAVAAPEAKQAKRYVFVPNFPNAATLPPDSLFTATLFHQEPSGTSDRSATTFVAAGSAPCCFPPAAFLRVMENLLRNPNITSSHLFRADICWDSEKDDSFEPLAWSNANESLVDVSNQALPPDLSSFVKAMRTELRPRAVNVRDFRLSRCVVRELIPRNTKRDRKVAQTCAFFRHTQVVGRHSANHVVPPEKEEHAQGNRDDYQVDPGGNEASNDDSALEQTLVIYIPHVNHEDELPFYHPKVQALAFLHTWQTPHPTARSSTKSLIDVSPADDSNSEQDSAENVDMDNAPGQISLHILPFHHSLPGSADDMAETRSSDANNRLHRTLLNLLSTLHSHGHGTLTGYVKRVHHDQIIPQPVLQDTYTRLKNKYAPMLLNDFWQEKTDARKGVFEDLGIASFLIGLWQTMYNVQNCVPLDERIYKTSQSTASPSATNGGHLQSKQLPFPGFVDIGCGNGVLTFILISEGYSGYGFDVRSRKTWDAFPQIVRENLHEMALIPAVLFTEHGSSDKSSDFVPKHISASRPVAVSEASSKESARAFKEVQMETHDGIFPGGTFIISNHADELTPWTPLLAYMSCCPFIAIPCCSHSLSGAKWRAPMPSKKKTTNGKQEKLNAAINSGADGLVYGDTEKGGRTGNLAQPPGSRATSAYASLCAYVEKLTEEVGFVVETEALRIPSTRNLAIVGRNVRRWLKNDGTDIDTPDAGTISGEYTEADRDGANTAHELVSVPIAEEDPGEDYEARLKYTGAIIERELARSISSVALEWVQKVEVLASSKGRNH